MEKPLDFVVFYDTGMEFQAIYNIRDKIKPILKDKGIKFSEGQWGGNMKLLVCCEESQTVCKAFREFGWEAYSCDVLENSGGGITNGIFNKMFYL